MVFTILAQQKITGKVVNETGQGMAEVTVVLNGTSIGTLTNEEGIFSINASKGNVLVFSYVGYNSKEIVVSDAAVLHVQLSAGGQLLDEVTITALGITKQKDPLVTQPLKLMDQNLHRQEKQISVML